MDDQPSLADVFVAVESLRRGLVQMLAIQAEQKGQLAEIKALLTKEDAGDSPLTDLIVKIDKIAKGVERIGEDVLWLRNERECRNDPNQTCYSSGGSKP